MKERCDRAISGSTRTLMRIEGQGRRVDAHLKSRPEVAIDEEEKSVIVSIPGSPDQLGH